MRCDDGRAVPTFFTQALRGQDLTIFGDGSQTRSFTYISDLVEGIVRLLGVDSPDPVNLGNPHEIPLIDVAHRILALVGSKSQIVYQPLPADDPKVRRPDIGRARELLGWQPAVDLDEGLRRTLPYFEQQVGQQD
jgi:dTDP-glucose 4,6-dehydratase